MSNTLRTVATIAGVVALAATGVGAIMGPTAFATLGIGSAGAIASPASSVHRRNIGRARRARA